MDDFADEKRKMIHWITPPILQKEIRADPKRPDSKGKEAS
jgi:hypothetical protein